MPGGEHICGERFYDVSMYSGSCWILWRMLYLAGFWEQEREGVNAVCFAISTYMGSLEGENRNPFDGKGLYSAPLRNSPSWLMSLMHQQGYSLYKQSFLFVNSHFLAFDSSLLYL